MKIMSSLNCHFRFSFFVIENLKFEWQCSQYLELNPTCGPARLYQGCALFGEFWLFASSRCERFHCNAMRKAIMAQELAHNSSNRAHPSVSNLSLYSVFLLLSVTNCHVYQISTYIAKVMNFIELDLSQEFNLSGWVGKITIMPKERICQVVKMPPITTACQIFMIKRYSSKLGE